MEITDAGLVFLADARSIVDATQKARHRFRGRIRDSGPELFIGTHEGHEAALMTVPLARLREDWPDLNPVIRSIPVPPMQIYHQLAEEDLDVVISYQEDVGHRRLEYTELTSFGMVAAMRRDHPLARKRAIDMDQLGGDRLILSSPRTCPMAVDRIQHRLCAGRNPDELRMCPTQDAARTLAEAGYGGALLPALGCRRDSGLTFVPVRDSGRLSYGIYCFSAAQKPETKRFVQYMKEAFSPS